MPKLPSNDINGNPATWRGKIIRKDPNLPIPWQAEFFPEEDIYYSSDRFGKKNTALKLQNVLVGDTEFENIKEDEFFKRVPFLIVKKITDDVLEEPPRDGVSGESLRKFVPRGDFVGGFLTVIDPFILNPYLSGIPGNNEPVFFTYTASPGSPEYCQFLPGNTSLPVTVELNGSYSDYPSIPEPGFEEDLQEFLTKAPKYRRIMLHGTDSIPFQPDPIKAPLFVVCLEVNTGEGPVLINNLVDTGEEFDVSQQVLDIGPLNDAKAAAFNSIGQYGKYYGDLSAAFAFGVSEFLTAIIDKYKNLFDEVRGN
jgi:hypothetical protein